MENYKSQLVTLMSKIDRRQIQIALLVLSLALLVLSAGAPAAHGDFGSAITP